MSIVKATINTKLNSNTLRAVRLVPAGRPSQLQSRTKFPRRNAAGM